jgi:hypothetical protein
LGACSFAIGQPLLDVLARHPTFLVAHRAEPGDIALLVVGLLVVPPAALALVVAAAGALGDPSRRVVRNFGIGGLVTLASLTASRGAFGEAVWTPVVLASASGCAAAFAMRFQPVRHFFVVLAGAPIVFAISFFANEGITTLMTSADPSAAVGAAVLPSSSPPIIMVVFDELPTISLLDEDGRIDEVRYPAFARLARGATWFRNASAVHYKTSQALPALLTGRYPDEARLPIAADHPENLFAWLGGTYELRVVETLTRLLGDSANEEPIDPARLLEDLSIVWLHELLPDPLTRDLPSVSQTWKGFAAEDHVPADVTLQREEQAALFKEGHLPPERREELFGDRRGRFLRFVEAIRPSERPVFHFLHILLPHRPWRYLPSGRAYTPTEDLGLKKGPWAPQKWWVVDSYQKHLLQLDFTDRLLGVLLDRLDETELYDRALVIVMSDHGVGFWPGENRRYPEMSHPSDVLGVPLFVKVPGQREGSVRGRNVETIDVAPTVADVLGVALPWKTDGCSALSSDCPPREEKRMYTHWGTIFTFGPQLDLEGESLMRKLRLFGSRSRAHERSAWGTHGGLVGRKLEDLDVMEGEAGSISLPRATFRSTARDPQTFASARITGTLRAEPTAGDVDLAVVVDGRVRAVTVAQRSGDSDEREESRFSAFLRESVLDRAGAKLALYAVEGPADAPRLRRAPIRLR